MISEPQPSPATPSPSHPAAGMVPGNAREGSERSGAGFDLHFPDGARVRARYELLEVLRLQPSHLLEPRLGRNGTVIARANPARVGVANAREYAGRRGQYAARLVYEHMQPEGLDPAHLLDGTYFVTTGPPVVSTRLPGAEGQGLVVAGNHRAMILRGAAMGTGDAFVIYRDALLTYLERTPGVGLAPQLADGMTHPVLVRAIVQVDIATDEARLDALNRVSDWALTKAMDPVSLAVAMADGLRSAPTALAHLTKTFGAQSLAAYLNGADAVTLVTAMQQEGAISPLLGAMLVHPKTGRLSAHVRHMMVQMLYAAALDEPDVLDVVSDAYLRRIEPALPLLASAPDTPAWRFLRDLLRRALKHFHREHQEDHRGNLIHTLSLFDFLEPDPRVLALVNALHTRGGGEFAERLRRWSDAVAPRADTVAATGYATAYPLFFDAPLDGGAKPELDDEQASSAEHVEALYDQHVGSVHRQPATARGVEWMLARLREDPDLARAYAAHVLPEALWQELVPLLNPPPTSPRRGGPIPTDDRGRVAGIVALRRLGVPWSHLYRWWPSLPQHPSRDKRAWRWRAGSYSVCAQRVSRWRAANEGATWRELCARCGIEPS